MRKNKVKTSELQKKAVNGIIEGKPAGQAMVDAGYSKVTASHPQQNLVARAGVQAYLEKFDEVSRRKFGMNLQEKLIETFTDGLEATKLFGKNAVKHEDHSTRFVYASKLSELLGWSKSVEVPNQQNTQYNFFAVGEEEQNIFSEKLKDFLKKSYAKE